jgi:hypothetical protein
MYKNIPQLAVIISVLRFLEVFDFAYTLLKVRLSQFSKIATEKFEGFLS